MLCHYVRFGVAESHGRGAALQLNTYLGDNAVLFNADTNKYQVIKISIINC